MKQIVLISFVVFSTIKLAYAQSVPAPVSNYQTAPAGSLVIAMDNLLQSANGTFNLKAYGLAVTLLNKNKKVKWVISAGKSKDAADFSSNAERVFPTAAAASMRNFKAGPFVIFRQDTTGCAAIINAFNASVLVSERVNVYRLTAAVAVDVRYDLYIYGSPKAAILDEGGHADIHIDYLEAAAIPDTNYQIVNAAGLNGRCFTFVSEPHNDDPGPYIDSVKKFVMLGGNFLAECAAIITYENYAPAGGFQTNGGYDNVNTDINSQVVYLQPDLAYSQYDGAFKPKVGGNTQTFALNPGATTKNQWSATTRGSIHTNVYGSTVSKLSPNFGGYVFYLGNHRYKDDELEEINGIRQYLNAFLTPSDPTVCTSGPLAAQLTSFIAQKNNSDVRLQWTLSSENNMKEYVIERSADGRNFSAIATIASRGNSSLQANYSAVDASPVAGKNYYRVNQVDIAGRVVYSEVKMINFDIGTKQFEVYPNPAYGFVTVNFDFTIANNSIAVFDLSGKKVLETRSTNANSAKLNISNIPQGSYFVQVTGLDGSIHRDKLLIMNR